MAVPTVVVGLGNIGGAIAERLVRCDADVVGVEQDEHRARDWSRQTGARAVQSLTELPWDIPRRVVVVVRMTEQAQAVIADIAARATAEVAIHVMTTLEPAAAREIASAASEGIRVLEQPVSGGAAGAAAGTLTVLSAGPMTAADEEFLLGTIAARVFRFDGYGRPTLAKLINNVAAAYNTRSAVAMLLEAERIGLDPTTVKAVLDCSSGGSAMGSMVGELGDDQATLLTKDVGLLAAEIGPLRALDITDGHGLLADLAAVRGLLRRSGDPR